MRHRRILPAILVIGVFALAVLSACADRDAPLFPRLDVETADAVELEYDGRLVSLAREADGWRIALPRGRGHADDDAVAAFLELVARARRSDVVSDAHGELETLGLADEGVGRLVVRSPGRVVVDARLGAVAPGPSRVFLMPRGDRDAFVSPDGLAEWLAQPLDEWRDDGIMAFRLPDVVGVEIVNRGVRAVLAPVDGRWVMTRPVEQDVEKGTVDGLLLSISDLSASGFENDRDPVDCGFVLAGDGSGGAVAGSRGSVTVRLSTGPPMRIAFGDPAGEMWHAMRGDRDDVYLVQRGLVELIFGVDEPVPGSR